MRRRTWTAAFAALTLLPSSTAGQVRSHAPAFPVPAVPAPPVAPPISILEIAPPAYQEARPSPADHTARTVLGASLGWVAGAGVGGLLGLAVTDDEYDDWVGFVGAVVGAGVGSSIGTAVGAHLGNGRRGNAVATFLATSATTVLLLVAADRADVPLVVIPVGQILTAVLAERTTGAGP